MNEGKKVPSETGVPTGDLPRCPKRPDDDDDYRALYADRQMVQQINQE